MGSSQHLHTSVSILLALSKDAASPQVQVWALHALALIADTGGPMFREEDGDPICANNSFRFVLQGVTQYRMGDCSETDSQCQSSDSEGLFFRTFVEPTLSTVLGLLLTVPATQLEVISCLGRVLSALITAVGPELQVKWTLHVRTNWNKPTCTLADERPWDCCGPIVVPVRMRGAAEPFSPRGPGRGRGVSPTAAPLLSAQLAVRDGGRGADALQVIAVAPLGAEAGVGGVFAAVGTERGKGGEWSGKRVSSSSAMMNFGII